MTDNYITTWVAIMQKCLLVNLSVQKLIVYCCGKDIFWSDD